MVLLCIMYTAVVHGPANYGYIQRDVGMGDELLVIVRRNKRNSQKPTSDIFKFPPLAKEATSAVSKVFLYNAVLSVDPMLQGPIKYYVIFSLYNNIILGNIQWNPR